jgi:hypothetical protein
LNNNERQTNFFSKKFSSQQMTIKTSIKNLPKNKITSNTHIYPYQFYQQNNALIIPKEAGTRK